MGRGDEIMGTGLARGFAKRGKLAAFGDGRKILWSQWCREIFAYNPNIALPGSENRKDIEWVEHYKGKRKYHDHNKPMNGRWNWNYDFRVSPGEFFFSESERAAGEAFANRDFIVIEPNLPWWKSVAPNKDWGEAKYRELAKRLRSDFQLIQFKHGTTTRILEGAALVETPFRQAMAILKHAKLYVGAEGGMHNAAAAVGTKAVILFGGWSPPQVVGYDDHINLTGGATEACGMLTACEHCRKALDNISVEEVWASVTQSWPQP